MIASGNTRLSATETIRALARLENTVSFYHPNMIFAINEGRTVADVVTSDLKLKIPTITMHGAFDKDLGWDGVVPRVRGSPIICVIGHVTKTGATMSRAMEIVRGKFATARVFGVALASSAKAATILDKGGPFLFHQVGDGNETIKLAFDANQGVREDGDSFILGGHSKTTADTLPVSRGFLKVVRKEMLEEYPVPKFPW